MCSYNNVLNKFWAWITEFDFRYDSGCFQTKHSWQAQHIYWFSRTKSKFQINKQIEVVSSMIKFNIMDRRQIMF